MKKTNNTTIMENILLLKKENFKFKKINLTTFIIYFAFYSFLGFCFESIFGIFSKGVLESRQSFLFGPFCAIYGIGSIFMILLLNPFKNNNLILFFGSAIIGATAEFLMSYLCELYFHFKWWDYSENLLNLGGRTCLLFATIWGILGVLLIKKVNPKLDYWIEKIENKISKKVFNFAIFGLTIFLAIDIFLSTFALKYFYAKIAIDYNLDSSYDAKQLAYYPDYNFLSENNLLKIYPNIRIAGTKLNNIFVDSLYNHEKTYYFKFFE